jgi:hypothetical protein
MEVANFWEQIFEEFLEEEGKISTMDVRKHLKLYSPY